MREWWTRLTYPLQRRRLERELQEEMALHVELRAERLEADGASAADAAMEAQRRFGNRSRVASASRDAWGWGWVDGFVDDLRYVARQLVRTPAFVLFASLTIALGVALNVTAFTFYDAVVLKPLPVARPDRMIRVLHDSAAFGGELLPYSAYDVVRRNARLVQSVVTTTGSQSFDAVLPGHSTDDGRIVTGRFVSSDFFRTLGVGAAIGRPFDASDDQVAVLDHAFWTRALNSDPTVVGRQLRIAGRDLTILGVAPASFAGTGMPASAPDVWLPLSTLESVQPSTNWRHDGRAHWQLLGRLAPGATAAQAARELAVLGRSATDSVGGPVKLVIKHATFFQTDAGEMEVFQQASVAFLVALALILSIAVVNLVNLFAARNAAREREVTVRLALGASRLRIGRQLASESVIVALLGGAIGLLLSHDAAIWLRNWISSTMSTVTGGLVGVFLDISIDGRVIAYTVAMSVAIGLAVGLWPALRAARGDVNTVLRQGATTTSRVGWTKRNLLLATQIASSLVLLTAAGMLLSGTRLSRAIDPGFDADHMLIVDMHDPAADSLRAVTRAEVIRQLAADPAVRAVTWAARVPFGGTHLRSANTTDLGHMTVSVDDIGPDYFDVMGMSIVRGRAFTRAEVESNAPVMIVSQSLARVRWPNGDAIGRSVEPKHLLSGPDSTKSYTVVGIVRDIRSNFLSRVNGPSVYYPARPVGPFGAILVRTRGAPTAAEQAVLRVVGRVSPSLTSRTHVLTMQDGPMSLQRLMAQAPASAALALAMIGLLLSAVGVYGLIAQIVASRRQEIGVYMAIGARRSQVIALVARKTLRPVFWGAIVGGFLAVGVSFFLRSMIAMPDVPDLTFGAGAFNPTVFLGVVLALSIVVVAACFVPARRATLVDPTIALKAE